MPPGQPTDALEAWEIGEPHIADVPTVVSGQNVLSCWLDVADDEDAAERW